MAHNLGILMSQSAAARNTEVPSGTVTSRPSTLSVMVFSVKRCGGTQVCFGNGLHRTSSYAGMRALTARRRQNLPEND